MRMDKLTSRFTAALQDAQSLAVGRDNNMIEPVHLLVALLDQRDRARVDLVVGPLALSGAGHGRRRDGEREGDRHETHQELHSLRRAA